MASEASSSSSASASPANKVLIIGGGIAGLSQALFLQRIGLACEVFEAYPPEKVASVGGLAVAPNGMNVLKFLGLDEALEARGSVISTYTFKNHMGKVLATIPLGPKERFGSNSVATSRLNLHRTLLEGIAAAGIQVNYQKRLVGIKEDSNSVTAQFEDGTSATGFMLIGADGVHSLTRRSIFPSIPGPYFLGLLGYGGFVPKEFLGNVPAANLPKPGEMSFIFGPKGFFGVSPGGKDDLGRDTLMWWSNQPLSEPGGDGAEVRKAIDAKSNEEMKADLHELYKDWFDPCNQLIANDSVHPPQRMLRQMIHDIADLSLWYKGRVVLIGDAAHAMSPNSGQGASQALEDTMQLAKILRDRKIGQGGDASPSVEALTAAFQEFQSLRKPRVDAINTEARRRSGEKTQTLGPWACWFRDQFMKVIFRLFGQKATTKEFSHRIEWDEEPKKEGQQGAGGGGPDPSSQPRRNSADDYANGVAPRLNAR